jgi:hypothetical protein
MDARQKTAGMTDRNGRFMGSLSKGVRTVLQQLAEADRFTLGAFFQGL